MPPTFCPGCGRLLAGALAVALIGGGIWGGAKLLKSQQRDNPYQPTTVETNERLSGVETPEEIPETNEDLPVITEPAATEPVVTEPTVTDPAATEPTTTEVVTTEPSEPTEPTEPDAYSGSYGENLTWRFDPNTGLLTIEGSGAMADNTDSEEYPWFTYRDVITGVVFSEGLTTVGRVAFEAYDNLPSVQFPEGLTFIDGEAFLDCPNLLSVTIPSGVTNIYDQTFGYVITARHSPNSTDPMEDFTIYGADGSAAQTYAEENGFQFIAQ